MHVCKGVLIGNSHTAIPSACLDSLSCLSLSNTKAFTALIAISGGTVPGSFVLQVMTEGCRFFPSQEGQETLGAGTLSFSHRPLEAAWARGAPDPGSGRAARGSGCQLCQRAVSNPFLRAPGWCGEIHLRRIFNNLLTVGSACGAIICFGICKTS